MTNPQSRGPQPAIAAFLLFAQQRIHGLVVAGTTLIGGAA